MSKNSNQEDKKNPKKADTVDFGSTIIIIFPESKYNVIHADGFIMPRVSLMDYEPGDHCANFKDRNFPDFSNSLFKIMPFFHSDSFSCQEQIREMLEKNFNQIFSFDSMKFILTRYSLPE